MMSMHYSDEYVELRLKQMVLESISSSYDIERKDALTLIEESTFLEILKDDPEFIGHYPPEYWAEYIIEERNLIHNKLN